MEDWLDFSDWILEWWDAIWNWFLALVHAVLDPVLTPLLAAISTLGGWVTSLVDQVTAYVPFLAFANAWAPVSPFFALLAVYSVFWLALVVYRSAKKWIPTLSG